MSGKAESAMQTALQSSDPTVLLRALGDEDLRTSALSMDHLPCQFDPHAPLQTPPSTSPFMVEEMEVPRCELPRGKQQLRSEAGFEPRSVDAGAGF